MIAKLSNREIKSRFLRPPTIAEVFDFVAEIGVSGAHFEYFYGIPNGTLRNVKCGNKPLPVAFWPIIFLKIKPEEHALQKSIQERKVTATKRATKPRKTSLHGRIKKVD